MTLATPTMTRRAVAMAGWALVALAAAFSCQSAMADYRVGSGDVFEISVLGVPDLTRRVTVEPNGTISVPLIGSLPVQGLSLAGLRAHVKAALGGRVVTLRGMSAPVPVNIDDVLVTVAAYRPVFVMGDVAKPGEYPYRAPMAIREAVALSGGYLRAASTGADNMLRSMDLRAELETLWLDFAAQQARLWRINAELGEKVEDRASVGKRVPANAPIDRSVLTRIVEVAAKHLEARRIDYRREREAIEKIISRLIEEISVMGAQVIEAEKSYEAEAEELARLTALKDKGIVTPQRFADARRDLLSVSTRVFMGTTRLHDAKRQKSERELQLHRLAADRRAALHQELETTTARLNEIRVKLRSTSGKLRFLGGTTFADGDAGRLRPTFVVRRRAAAGVERLAADEDFELLPGDVVDVAVTGEVALAEGRSAR